MDEFAFLRGQRYGTILIDQEKRCPVDLLPDREGATLERWLAAHPGVQIVTRDRGTTYAEALSRAAPQAQQVADRFHLLQNLTEAFGDWLTSRMPALRKALIPQELARPISRQIARVERRRQQSRQRRLDYYEQVRCLRAQGLNAQHIAAAVGVCPDTVYTYLNAPAFPERTPLPPKSSPLDPFVPYLRQRWEEGCHNALNWCARGARTAFPAQTVPNLALPRPRALMWLLTAPEERSDEQQNPLLKKLLSLCPEVAAARNLVHSFFELSRRRAGEAELEAWLSQAKGSGRDKFVSFARGIERDRGAVVAGLSQPWSNGPVEGQVSRLK